MSKQLTLLSILFSVVVALASCRGGNNTSLSVEGGDTVALKYSSLLTIVEHDGHTTEVAYEVEIEISTQETGFVDIVLFRLFI